MQLYIKCLITASSFILCIVSLMIPTVVKPELASEFIMFTIVAVLSLTAGIRSIIQLVFEFKSGTIHKF